MSGPTFISIASARPDDGETVEVLTPGGDIRPLLYRDGLWLLPDGSMYVHFTPIGWREMSA